MSTEYGATNNRGDEETPLLTTQVEPQTCWQKVKSKLHEHRVRVIIGWLTVLAATAVLTLSFHFALKHHHGDKNTGGEGSGDDLIQQCVSDRSYIIAVILAVFTGPFGIDRFYLGYVFWGIIKLLTGGVFGILYVIDVILIAVNALPDSSGCILH
ncbi:unnamed protein product [Cunninghamella echinulata]